MASDYERFVLPKRVMDFAIALAGYFWPSYSAVVSPMIKLDSPGPVLLRQKRVGESDRIFTLLKFRTMRQDAEISTGAVWAQKNDPRVTRRRAFCAKAESTKLQL
jgi:lipopolysaccharide/colanic/teichoic acid biosynthesis glycosyltransferase